MHSFFFFLGFSLFFAPPFIFFSFASLVPNDILHLLVPKITLTSFTHLNQILSSASDDDWAIAHFGWLAYLSGDLQTAKSRLTEAIQKAGSVAKYHFWMGKILWDTKSESPLQELLVAAKLDPSILT
jgi:hypothetical protein